jgi:hypothetical protein
MYENCLKADYEIATYAVTIVTPIISKLNNHEKLAFFLFNVVEILDNILSLTLANLNHEEWVSLEKIHFCSYFHTFFQFMKRETATDAATTVFEKKYIGYYRFVVNISVNFLVAL